MATKPNTFTGNFYGGTGGLGCQASYSIDSHLVFFADGCTDNFVPKAINQIYSYNAGGGYFGAIGENLNAEVMAGIGYGHSDGDVSNNLAFRAFPTTEHDILHGSYQRLFLQFDLVRTYPKGNQFGFGIRFSDFNPERFYFRKILTENRQGYAPFISDDSTLSTIKGGWIIEPEVNFRIKMGDHSFFNTAIGFSVPTIQQNPYSSFNSVFGFFIFTAGFGFEI